MSAKRRQQLIQFAKQAWLILVFGGVIFYIYRNIDEMMEYVRMVSPLRLFIAFGLIMITRFFLIELSCRSVNLGGGSIPYKPMFYLSSLSQLAKYLPGGVWHFVGRAGYYHTYGLTPKQTFQSMVIENIWLISSSGFIGAVLLLSRELTPINIAGIIALIVGWFALQAGIFYRQYKRVPLTSFLGVVAIQITVWILLGTSLWIIIPQPDMFSLYTLIVGTFCVGWMIGFVSIFAPGGLGVREGFIVFALGAFYPSSVILTYVTLHRIIFIGVEVVLGLVAQFVVKQPKIDVTTQTETETGEVS